jgi:formylglycine-generating enzyme required for sulfatase activity
VVAAPVATITLPQYVTAGQGGYKANVPSEQTGMTYAWGVTNGTITGGQGTREVTFTAGTTGTATTLSCTVTNQAGTQANDSKASTIVAAPVAIITAPAYVTSNKGGYTASVPSQAGMTYVWTIVNGAITAGDGASQITFAAGTLGTVTLSCKVTNLAGTEANDSKSPIIVALPSILSFTSADSTIDYGAKTSVTGVFSGGTGTVDNGVGAVNSGEAKTVGPLTVTTNYTLTVTNLAGDSKTANTTINVNQVVVADITPDAPDVSAGLTRQFYSAVTGAVDKTIDWSADGGSIDNTGLFTAPATLDTVTITATSHADPSKFKKTTARIVAPPVITSFKADSNVIEYGKATNLTAVFAGGAGTVDNGIGKVTSGTPVSTGLLYKDTTFSLTVTNTAGDSVKADVLVKVVVTAPVLNPKEGSYFDAQSVTMNCLIIGAEIYYTLDGTTPTTGSTKYTGPVLVDKTTTVKAIAAKAGCTDSAVVTAVYTITCGPSPTGKGGYMCDVPAGDFWMGCNTAVDSECGTDENPYHKVTVPAFRIDKYEVTANDYKACNTASPSTCTTPNATQYCNWGVSGRESDPINCVDWNQAKAYCEWAGKRLPTEAEWEKAARGTDGRKYPWGNTGLDCDHAVMSVSPCYNSRTAVVGSKPSGISPYGAMDMIGNVWEWVEDDYHDTYTGAPTNGSAWIDTPRLSNRPVRGGYWNTTYTAYLRSSERHVDAKTSRGNYGGFRCSRD